MSRAPSPDTLDVILSAQLVVAWAGEAADEDEPRLGWWRADLTSEFGGVDLFERLLPRTGAWAAFEAARVVAIQHDAALRRQSHDADAIRTLFHLGVDLDERLAERLATHKRAGVPPLTALAPVGDLCVDPFDAAAFTAWLDTHAGPGFTVTPVGRRLKGKPPTDPREQVAALLAALAPLADAWPVPYFEAA